MVIEIRSVDIVARCDVCNMQVSLHVDHYSRMAETSSGHRLKPSMTLIYDKASPE